MSDPKRRVFLQADAALFGGGLLNALSGCATMAAPAASGGMTVPSTSISDFSPTFRAIAPSMADAIEVPEGYSATAFAPWGKPVGIAGNRPAFKHDASNSAADQAVQIGMHHDGMHFYPFNGSNRHGLLVMNHEYTDDGLLHVNGMSNWSAEKVRKSQAGHGVSVIEIKRQGNAWDIVRPSTYARRFTSFSPFTVTGHVAGHPMMQTAATLATVRCWARSTTAPVA